MTRPILEVTDLAIEFITDAGPALAVDGVSLEVGEGEVLAVVGESGSGKSVTALSILGLLPEVASVVGGRIDFDGTPLLGASERQLRKIRGGDIAIIFQEPIGSLNPLIKVGNQIQEAIRAHNDVDRSTAHQRAIELLRMVHVPAPEQRASEYPHQFSGGMAQRVSIAMALANKPRLLIADEPTTALDVTVQAQVLASLREVQREAGAAMILITHDMGLVAETADRVTVMYAGSVVESGPASEVLTSPRHPYTRGLLRSLPRIEGSTHQRLSPIPGQPRLLGDSRIGCRFVDRCDLARGRSDCLEIQPELLPRRRGVLAACHFSEELEQAPA